jgi:hypothetical protein
VSSRVAPGSAARARGAAGADVVERDRSSGGQCASVADWPCCFSLSPFLLPRRITFVLFSKNRTSTVVFVSSAPRVLKYLCFSMNSHCSLQRT